jgi:hypothetical protein
MILRKIKVFLLKDIMIIKYQKYNYHLIKEIIYMKLKIIIGLYNFNILLQIKDGMSDMFYLVLEEKIMDILLGEQAKLFDVP